MTALATTKKAKKQAEPTPLQTFKGSKMEQLQQLYAQWYGCTRCVLSTFRVYNSGEPFQDVCFGDGNPDSKILLVGEAPGAEEELTGIPFVGPSGKLLNTILAATSADPDIQQLFGWFNNTRHTREVEEQFHETMQAWRKKEFFTTNVVACRPPENRTPSHPEVKACWERLFNIIYIVDPWLIITFGRPAIETLVRKQVEVTKKRGSLFDVEIPGRVVTYRIPVMCCLHPSYLLRVADYKNKSGNYVKTVRDVMAALKYVDGLKYRLTGVPPPYRPELP
jgi:uracil-DNA glycosylase